LKFYDLLQLDPAGLKRLIDKSESKKQRGFLWAAMFFRSILLVLFAIVFIAPLSSVFGKENNAMAVSMFCILLAVRFVDFGYCIKDSLINLGIVFLLLLISPVLSYYVNPLFAFFIHFLSYIVILFITCDKPEMGNGGLYSFAYVFLCGNPVQGVLFFKRFLLTCFCFLICAAVFYKKHKGKHTDISFQSKIKQFDFYTKKHQWQIRMALGISFILTLGAFFQLERYMWIGFACGSLLSDHNFETKLKEKSMHRILGVLAGSALFYVLYMLMPKSMHSMIGIFGGILLGLCSQYKHKTVLNCLGALMAATGIYGIQEAVILRITDNLIGVVFAFLFFFVYEFLMEKLYQRKMA